jgi:aconitase A
MRPLAVLPDNITTDHLSPSNAILLDSAAGEYLARWACRKRTSTPTPPIAATT